MVTVDDVPPFVAAIGLMYDARYVIVVEKTIIINNIDDFAKAVALLMGVIYAMDMQYPGKLMYEFLQKIILGLKGSGKQMSKRLTTLKNRL